MNRNNKLSVGIAVAALCALTITVFGQVSGFEFINYDDQFFITQNPHVTDGLTADNVLWSLSTSRMGIWHPLTWISYQLEISIFGENIPGVHHTTNFLLHLLNTVLVFVLSLRLTGNVWPSMIVAVLFCIHPQHVQPVAWISERKEVLAAAFFLLSANLYVRFLARPETRRLYVLSLLSFAVALLCKPSVAPLPVILVLIAFFYQPVSDGRGMSSLRFTPLDARRTLQLLIQQLPFIALTLVVSAITIYIKKTGHWVSYEEAFHLGRRLLLMPIGLVHYVKAMFVPWPNPIWIEAPEGMPYLRSLFSLGVLLSLAFGVWALRRRVPELAFGALWFVVMWLPVSGIVLVSNYFVADRYTYLPYVGAFIGVVFLVDRLCTTSTSGSPGCVVLSLPIVVALAVMAHKQTSYWRDDFTFFAREAVINPDIPLAPLHVGHALFEEGKGEEALRMVNRSLELDDEIPKSHTFKGDILRSMGRGREAMIAYQAAIDRDVDRADTYVHLGLLLLKDGDTERAVDAFEKGLERFPGDVYLLNQLAHVYGFDMDRSGTARDYYGRVLEYDADNVDALLGLGILDLRSGNAKDGVGRLEKVLDIDPDNETARAAIEPYYPQ